jgi:thioredoxin reductase (NADPH)
MVAQSVVHIDSSRQPYKVVLESGLKFETRTIVIATGAQYARLPVEDADAFTGRGVYYNATHMEAQLCESEEVIVVGGGNSAGQAAVCLAQSSAKVHLLVRSRKLSDSMSQYLIGRIEAHPRIEVHFLTQITGLRGAAHLESVEWRDDVSVGVNVTRPIRHVFVMAGAAPRTEWLEDSFVLDKNGFIVTGPDLAGYADLSWPLERSPLLLETSVPGIFAVGDARAGSVKRVASAVGEGSMAVHLVHRFFSEGTEQAAPAEPEQAAVSASAL